MSRKKTNKVDRTGNIMVDPTAKELGLKLLLDGEYKPNEVDGYVLVTVEGPTREALDDPAAKRLVLTLCAEYNRDGGGVESYTSTQTKPAKANGKPSGAFIRTFRITPGVPSIKL